MPKEWLTLKDASDLLGVHPSTLRRWSDDGKVASMRTEGGHRRFNRQEIEAYLAAEPEADTEAEATRSESVPAPVSFDAKPWRGAFDDEERSQARELGQRLIGLMLQYITRQNEDERFLEESRAVGRRYGTTVANAGLSLLEMVEAFLYFRSQITSMALQLPAFPQPGDEEETRRLHGRIDGFMNEVLLGTIEGYESATDGT